ncbi:MAG: hypothetical protein ACYTG5_13475, partial [Planctomycetota bacterium]
NKRNFKEGERVFLARPNNGDVVPATVTLWHVTDSESGLRSEPSVGRMFGGKERVFLKVGDQKWADHYAHHLVHRKEAKAIAALRRELSERIEAGEQDLACAERQVQMEKRELDRYKLLLEGAPKEAVKPTKPAPKLPDGWVQEDLIELDRVSGGVDYGAPRRVLIKKGVRQLMKRDGYTYHHHGAEYQAARWTLIDTSTGCYPYRETDLFEGRASKKRWEEKLADIRLFFGTADLTVEMIDTNKTLVIPSE